MVGPGFLQGLGHFRRFASRPDCGGGFLGSSAASTAAAAPASKRLCARFHGDLVRIVRNSREIGLLLKSSLSAGSREESSAGLRLEPAGD